MLISVVKVQEINFRMTFWIHAYLINILDMSNIGINMMPIKNDCPSGTNSELF